MKAFVYRRHEVTDEIQIDEQDAHFLHEYTWARVASGYVQSSGGRPHRRLQPCQAYPGTMIATCKVASCPYYRLCAVTCIRPPGYLGPERTIYLARLIVGAKPGQYVKYRNSDTLDFRRANLVIVNGPRAKIPPCPVCPLSK